jgi:RNA polymerase sigma-70 factor (ECF subfamily)
MVASPTPLRAGSPDGSTDESLVARACKGDRAAFDVLVTRYERRIYRLGVRMSHNPADAEEIAQETFLRAHRNLGAFEGGSRFGTWLYRIAVNEALMRRRAARRRPTDSLDDLVSSRGDGTFARAAATSGSVDEWIDEKVDAERVRAALAELDDAHRAALVLRDLEGLSSHEAAAVLGITPATVRQRAHRAKLKLRTALLGPGAANLG